MNALKIHPSDNVMVALTAVESGAVMLGIAALEATPAGHKIALRDIGADEPIIKYGSPIGISTRPIKKGAWVHTHNVRTLLSSTLEYTYRPEWAAPAQAAPDQFMGYVREGGGVGIRNEVFIIPTVGCVSHTAQAVARRAERLFGARVDGIHAFSHVHGCSQMGRDLETTQRTLAALVNHPNAGAVLVMGLGCEYNYVDVFKQFVGEQPPGRVMYMACQDEGDEQAAALERLDALTAYAQTFRRQPCPASMLKVGLKCGGSDGFSGVTANPLLGALSDRLCAQGATTLLTEVPEMFGAEHLLMARCVDRDTFDQTVALINDYKRYLKRYGEVISENPSPGNKAGGITTLEDKSLGCTQKGGLSPVTDVLPIGCAAQKPGLALVDGPGNDLCAVTGLAASGAHMVLFTTGRGTPYGGPVPTLKIATHSELAARKPGWIDFNAGRLIEGESMDALSDALMRLVLGTASGKPAQNEVGGYREIAIFKDGVTL